MSRIRPGTCGAPGPYAAHCTDYPGHRYSCYDAGEDVSFNEGMMRDTGLVHDCDDPKCLARTNRESGDSGSAPSTEGNAS